jgi:molybdate transport system ATP-binding protein
MSRLSLCVDLSHGPFTLNVDDEFELAPITAVFGPSGAGKTTLLRTIAGLERAARGRVALDGTVWQDSPAKLFCPPHRRRVGYVFQDGRLFPHLNVAGNLTFGYRAARLGHRLAPADVVTAMDLGPLLERRPQSLSGGEQQRVAIGRALLTDPVLMLMDEPLSALDAARKAEIIPYIERVAHDFRVPILYVTHTIEEVSRLARNMLLLADGRVAAYGRTPELLERIDLWPITGRAAAGTLLTARIVGSERGMTALTIAGQILRIPAIDGTAGTAVQLRMAAKDVAIATARPSGLSIRNVLEAQILAIDELPPVYAEVLLDVSGQHLRAEITREAAAELGLSPGQRVYALIKSVAIDRSLLS